VAPPSTSRLHYSTILAACQYFLRPRALTARPRHAAAPSRRFGTSGRLDGRVGTRASPVRPRSGQASSIIDRILRYAASQLLRTHPLETVRPNGRSTKP